MSLHEGLVRGVSALNLPALLFVIVAFATAVGLGRWIGLRMGREATVAAVRGAVQLTAVGLVFVVLLERGDPLLVGAVLVVMVVAAGWTAVARAHRRHAFPVATVVIAVTAAALVLPLVALDLFATRPLFLVPITGMVLGNAMNATALGMDRMDRELRVTLPAIEARLALGVDERVAVAPSVAQTIRAAMLPTMNTLRTVGLVHLPGIMTGMLIAGAPPLLAVEMQFVIILVILTGAFVASSTMALWLRRGFLRDLDSAGLDHWREDQTDREVGT